MILSHCLERLNALLDVREDGAWMLVLDILLAHSAMNSPCVKWTFFYFVPLDVYCMTMQMTLLPY